MSYKSEEIERKKAYEQLPESREVRKRYNNSKLGQDRTARFKGNHPGYARKYQRTERGRNSLLISRCNARGLGWRKHYRNIIDEYYAFHHITDKSMVAIPYDLHNLYSGNIDKVETYSLEQHRFLCWQVIKQIYYVNN